MEPARRDWKYGLSSARTDLHYSSLWANKEQKIFPEINNQHSITLLAFPQSESALAAPSWTPLPRLLPSASRTSSVSLTSRFCSLSPSCRHQRNYSYQCKCDCPHPSGNHGDRSSGSLRWSCDRTACICSRGPPDIRQSLREKSRNEAWCEKTKCKKGFQIALIYFRQVL